MPKWLRGLKYFKDNYSEPCQTPKMKRFAKIVNA